MHTVLILHRTLLNAIVLTALYHRGLSLSIWGCLILDQAAINVDTEAVNTASRPSPQNTLGFSASLIAQR